MKRPYNAPETSLDRSWLDSSDVKRVFHLSDSTLYRLRTQKKIPHTKLGGKFFYPSSFFITTMNKRCNAVDAKP